MPTSNPGKAQALGRTRAVSGSRAKAHLIPGKGVSIQRARRQQQPFWGFLFVSLNYYYYDDFNRERGRESEGQSERERLLSRLHAQHRARRGLDPTTVSS